VWTVVDLCGLFDGLDTVLLRVRGVNAAEAWYRE
jgi:hypothetical protein